MNGDDLAAVLFEEQGYIVVSTFEPYRIGDIVKDGLPKPAAAGLIIPPAITPFRIVAESSREEAVRQGARMAELTGAAEVTPPRPYNYRAVGAD